jgi:hypothetical protein
MEEQSEHLVGLLRDFLEASTPMSEPLGREKRQATNLALPTNTAKPDPPQSDSVTSTPGSKICRRQALLMGAAFVAGTAVGRARDAPHGSESVTWG